MVVILGILAALIVPRVSGGSDTAKTRLLHNRAEINVTLSSTICHGHWPANDLSDIGRRELFPGGLPTCPSAAALSD